MRGAIQTRGWTLARRCGPVVLVTHIGDATGSRAAATALACAASEPERAALLIDLDGSRAPRSSLIATAGARELEERLAAHMPEATIASRGQVGHLKLPADPTGIEQVPAALPLVRESAAVMLLSPPLLQPLLEEPRIPATAALLCADLSEDRALTALAVRDLMARGLRVVVVKQAPGWLAARWTLFGALPLGEVLPARQLKQLLGDEDNKLRQCYDGKDETEGEKRESPVREGQESVRTRWKVAAERGERRSSK